MNRQVIARYQIVSGLLVIFIPLIFITGITFFQFFYNIPLENKARAEGWSSIKLARTAYAIDEAVQDAERGQSGYLITGKDAYLDPYTRAEAKIPELMNDLLQETNADQNVQPRILQLQADVTTKMNELASTITAMRGKGYEAARAIVQSDVGRNAMDNIHDNLTAILSEANDQLDADREEVTRTRHRASVTFLIASLAAATALLLGSFLMIRAYRRAANSESLLQDTLDGVHEGVAAFDKNRHLLAWNAPFEKKIGSLGVLKRGQPLPGKSDDNDEASDISGMLHTRIQSLVETVRLTGRSAMLEQKGKRGSLYEIFLHPTQDDGYVVTFLDVTDRRQAEEALRQAQKLEALGQMTGGVAHDFNNLLTIIIGSLGFLHRTAGMDAKAHERIDMINIAAERGAKLTKQLLAFARRQPLEPETINLGQVMQEILPLIRRAVGESIVVECVTAGGLWNTNVDASQFQSAILNLAINSRDAMSEGGKMTIEVNNAALDSNYAARHAEVTPGQYVVFAITDTGHGMDSNTMDRALDPFFTTKQIGEGTGLGLPQVYGFVKQSGGHLKIYSEVGEGTTIKLYLPRSFGKEAVQPFRPTGLALTGAETILLVDDDQIVRATVASMLEDLGYSVETAADGADAIARLEAGLKPDLLFTDVVMPGKIGGRKLAERAVEILPNLKVLFTSGYTENAIVHNGRLDAGVELLSKPYDRETLAAKLRRVLDQKTEGSQSSRQPGAG